MTFALDRLKGLGLQLLLGAPLLYGLFWLLAAMPRLWWLLGWAACVAIIIALTVIYPMWIAPLFNKFTPLPEGGMKSRIEELLKRCGFESNGLFVMDAWKRSSHGNAYFSGFGRAKRIVFFDTLLEKHSEDEILSILAHELGHFKLGHIGQRLAQSAAFMFILFAALHWAFCWRPRQPVRVAGRSWRRPHHRHDRARADPASRRAARQLAVAPGRIRGR